MRKGKYHMKIRSIDHLSAAFIYPDLLIDRLAIRAVTVTAGIIVEFCMSAVRTLGDVDAKFAGFAVLDSPGNLKLDIGLEAPG